MPESTLPLRKRDRRAGLSAARRSSWPAWRWKVAGKPASRRMRTRGFAAPAFAECALVERPILNSKMAGKVGWDGRECFLTAGLRAPTRYAGAWFRAEIVEYRVEQHAGTLRERLEGLNQLALW